MTDERTITITLTEGEARVAASALGWGTYGGARGNAAYGKIRAALNALGAEPETEAVPPPEKPKRGRPRKAPAEK